MRTVDPLPLVREELPALVDFEILKKTECPLNDFLIGHELGEEKLSTRPPAHLAGYRILAPGLDLNENPALRTDADNKIVVALITNFISQAPDPAVKLI